MDSDDETVSRVPRSKTENYMVLERPDSASTDVYVNSYITALLSIKVLFDNYVKN